MSIVRIERVERKKFSIINNEALEIPTLSWRAKGMWAYLMSRPDDWVVSVAHLSKNFSGGRDLVRSALRELEKHGLCTSILLRGEKGKLDGIDYKIHEKPLKNKVPRTENPAPDKPGPANPTLLNTEDNKKYKKKSSSPVPAKAATVSSEEEDFSKKLKEIGISDPDCLKLSKLSNPRHEIILAAKETIKRYKNSKVEPRSLFALISTALEERWCDEETKGTREERNRAIANARYLKFDSTKVGPLNGWNIEITRNEVIASQGSMSKIFPYCESDFEEKMEGFLKLTKIK